MLLGFKVCNIDIYNELDLWHSFSLLDEVEYMCRITLKKCKEHRSNFFLIG